MICFFDKVRDKVTGFEGVVTAIHDPMTSAYQYGLQPPVKPDGNLPEIVTFDADAFEILEKKNQDQRVPFENALYNYRDQVKCIITGFQGQVVSRTEFLNGCIQYRVQGPLKKDGTIPSPERFAERQLILVKPAPKKAVVKSGGPIMRGPL
jgi:hypothetical protein